VGQNALSGFEGPDSPDATGSYNTGIGATALYSYSTGGSNTASGYGALYADTTGSNNTALGVHALASTTSGSNNIAQGWHAGINLTTGSNNIDIGSPGVKAETDFDPVSHVRRWHLWRQDGNGGHGGLHRFERTAGYGVILNKVQGRHPTDRERKRAAA